MENKVTLGQIVTDGVTGYTGTAIGRAEYLYTGPAVLVASATLNSDGKPNEVWVDEKRLCSPNT